MLRDYQVPFKAISEEFKVNDFTLRKRLQRHREIRGLPPKEIYLGSCISAYWGLQIKRSVLEEPLLSQRDRHCFLNPPFSRTTMTTYMTTNNLVPLTRQRRIVFTDKHKKDRVDFAHRMLQHFDNDYEFGRRIMWSDEKFFRVGSFASQPVYYSYYKRPDMFLPKFQGNQSGAMMWGVFSYYGKGPLVRVEGKIDHVEYINLLNDYMLPEYNAARSLFRPIWQQDGAPAHRHSETAIFLESHGIDCLRWPACSPDLSPIEDVWGAFAARIKKMESVGSVPKMVNVVLDMWDDLDNSFLETLSDSFRYRCEKVLELEGDLINKFYL